MVCAVHVNEVERGPRRIVQRQSHPRVRTACPWIPHSMPRRRVLLRCKRDSSWTPLAPFTTQTELEGESLESHALAPASGLAAPLSRSHFGE
jgi:hypothetical protein